MKNYKKKRGSIFLLLLKNYIFYSIVIMITWVIINSIVSMVFDKKYNFGLGLSVDDKKLLVEEAFDKLNVKSIAGRNGEIEILNENNDIIYSSSNNKDKYTESELNFIQNYEGEYIYTGIYDFKGEDNNDYKIIISTPYDINENGESYYNIDKGWFKVLDSNLNVVYHLGDNSDNINSYTEEELGYITGDYPKEYYLTKYTYVNKNGENRTAIIKSKKVNEEVLYESFDKLNNISFGLFFIACIICTIIFGLFLKKKVQKPLNKLNRAMQLLSEGKNNEEIIYSGPKEFVEICESFNVMVNKLESSELERNKLIKDKQSMLADISHDLKTPITTIQGYSKALADGVISPAEYEKYFNIIYSKANRLTELINIFYEYSKLEHPSFKLALEEVDLAEYLREYIAIKYEDILENGFSIEVDIPEKVMECKIDKVQFQRVLDNILGNAMKHNPVGTEIYVALSNEKGSYKIIIADNGVGIPQDIVNYIFSPFTVGDESRNTKQGSGLGLAITKTIVEMHNGTIKLNKSLQRMYKTVFEIEI